LDGGLPRAVAISWGMVADPQRGPKRELSHERIVEAAIGIADAEGLGAVTMSKVAAALGFTTMALYRYVTAKDDLLQLMADAVAGEVLLDSDRGLGDGKHEGIVDPDWRTQLRQFAAQMLGIYRDHPWLGDVPVSEAQLLTPNNLAIVDRAMRCMRGLEIPDADKVRALLLITNYVRASSMMERDIASDGRLNRSRIPAELVRELVTEERFPDLAPLVQSGGYLQDAAAADGDPDPEPDVGASEGDDDFGFGLEIILGGLQTHAELGGRLEIVRPEPGWRDHGQLAEALTLDHVRKDPKVRDAIGRVRDAEGKLRDARARQRDTIRNALERGPRS
jgi:AcrR family transcriptional regulator